MIRRAPHPVRARRGFTALELMMATAVGSVVLLAALGVFAMMERMDRFHSARFHEAADTAFARTVIQRAMQTMVAKAPPADSELIERATGINPARSNRADDGNDALREEMGRRANIGMLHGERGEFRDDADGEGLTLDERGQRVKPRGMFVLEPTGAVSITDASVPARVELTMLAQPAPGAPGSALFVRGAFEVEPRRRGWALMYRPLNPAGDPIELLDGVTAMEWQVLVRGDAGAKSLFESAGLRPGSPDESKGGEWRSVLSAEMPLDFPKAVRLRALLTTGRTIDWLFEPSITTGGVE